MARRYQHKGQGRKSHRHNEPRRFRMRSGVTSQLLVGPVITEPEERVEYLGPDYPPPPPEASGEDF